MIQGCFSNPTSPSFRITSTQTSQIPKSKENLVTCTYQTSLCDTPIFLTLTWSKTPYSHSLTIHAPEFFSITFSLHHSAFSLFGTRRHGSKSIHIDSLQEKIKLYWDFSRAEFTGPNSAEPVSKFYLGIMYNGRLEFFLGDQWTELTRRVRVMNTPELALLSRREHVFGKRVFSTRAEILGSTRLIEIECGSGSLCVKVNGEKKVTVKRLAWKFRGNERIFIDGMGVEFYWDVFNWVGSNVNNYQKNGVFAFQVGEGGCVWPEMVGPEKKLMRKSSPAPGMSPALSSAGSWSSVLQWAEESSDCGRSSSSGSSSATGRSYGSSSGGGSSGGFSLVLYAWRRG